MKKFMKKAMSIIAGAAMAFTMVVVPSVKAAAAETIYVIGDFCGWSWDSCGTMTSTDGVNFTGDINVSSDSAIVLNKANNWDGGDSAKYTYNYGGDSGIQLTVSFPEAGTYTLEYSTSTQDLTVKAKSTVTVNWTYEYYIAGPAALGANDWAGNEVAAAGKMTEKDGVYTLTTTATGAGTEFCVVKYGVPDVDGIDNTTEWLKCPETKGNFAIADTIEAGNSVTFTFNPADGTCTVEVKSTPQGGDDTTGDDTTGDDTEKNPSEDTSDVETDSVVNITEDEIKELEDAVVVEGAEDKLVISVVPEDSADLDVIAAADVLKNVKYVAVDLKFESGNQPEEGTKITFPIAKIASVKDTAYVSVYRVDADKLKLIEVVKVKDGNITFEPDHFSTYVFAEANEADYNKYLNDQEAGVSLPIVALIAVAALAGGCVVFSSKRKHA